MNEVRTQSEMYKLLQQQGELIKGLQDQVGKQQEQLTTLMTCVLRTRTTTAARGLRPPLRCYRYGELGHTRARCTAQLDEEAAQVSSVGPTPRPSQTCSAQKLVSPELNAQAPSL